MNNSNKTIEETKLYRDLHDKLKSMKFSGMAEELRHQMEDPNSDLRSFQDRFNDLVTAEWTLRYNKKFSRYLKKAHLKITGASFDETLYDSKRQLDTDTIERLSTRRWIQEGRNLLVTGMTGTGKTYFINAMGIADVLRIKKAPFVLLENVDRLLKSPARQRGRDFGIMLRTFDELGYNVEWRVINAAEYGCAQRRRRVFIFAWRKDTKYNKNIDSVYAESYLFKNGLFASSFPVEDPEDFVNDFKLIDLTKYQDTVEMTSLFQARFENTGIMIDGLVVTGKTIPIQVKPITLREVREDRNHLEHYFLTDSQNEKFEYLRGPKKIERRNPNGEIYYYSEGGMCYPDNLDLPGRTMLTSEGSINRSTHVIEDKETGKNRLLTPIEAERLQSFPDDWTNTGMPEKRRYFMMGNALVTKIINKLEPNLREIINNE